MATAKIMSSVVRVLPRLAVDPQPQAEALRVGDLVGGDQPRAERVEGLAALALGPLAAAASSWNSRSETSLAIA